MAKHVLGTWKYQQEIELSYGLLIFIWRAQVAQVNAGTTISKSIMVEVRVLVNWETSCVVQVGPATRFLLAIDYILDGNPMEIQIIRASK